MAWITDGESGADVRAKLNALAIPIESATISAPVEYLDIDLPSGYSAFVLRLVDWMVSPHDTMAAFLSSDAGVTFHDASDDYLVNEIEQINDDATFEFGDTVIYLTSTSVYNGEVVTTQGAQITVEICPGSASLKATATSVGFWNPGNAGDDKYGIMKATFDDAVGRQDAIRLAPYGNGDANPPTSGNEITGGSYFLYGIPTP